jgi:hypothetical protein
VHHLLFCWHPFYCIYNQLHTGVTSQRLAPSPPSISLSLLLSLCYCPEGGLEKPIALEGLQIFWSSRQLTFRNVGNMDKCFPVSSLRHMILRNVLPILLSPIFAVCSVSFFLVPHSPNKTFTSQNKSSTPKPLTQFLLSGSIRLGFLPVTKLFGLVFSGLYFLNHQFNSSSLMLTWLFWFLLLL